MREKLTVSIDEELIKDIEQTRTVKTQYAKTTQDKSHFIETLLLIGLHSYRQKQKFFDTINLQNIDLSKINF
jgi:predicted transcriptional regulator